MKGIQRGRESRKWTEDGGREAHLNICRRSLIKEETEAVEEVFCPKLKPLFLL